MFNTIFSYISSTFPCTPSRPSQVIETSDKKEEIMKIMQQKASAMDLKKEIDVEIYFEDKAEVDYNILQPRRVTLRINPNEFTKEELPFVISHELAHIKHRDPMSLILVSSIAFCGMSILLRSRLRHSSQISSLVHLTGACILSAKFSSFSVLPLRRWMELRADATALRYASKEEKMGALTTLSKSLELEDQVNNNLHPLVRIKKRFFSSHPPVQTRIEQVKKSLEMDDSPFCRKSDRNPTQARL